MQQPAVVGVADRFGDADQDVQVFVERQFVDPLAPRRPVDAFHRIEQSAGGVVAGQFMDRDDAGMVQRSDHAGFVQKPSAGPGLVVQFRPQIFEGDLAIDAPMVRLINDRRAPASQLTHQPVIDRAAVVGFRLADVMDAACGEVTVVGHRRCDGPRAGGVSTVNLLRDDRRGVERPVQRRRVGRRHVR